MARTIQQVYDQLVSRYVTEMGKVGFVTDPSTWSKVNLRRLFFWVVGIGIVTVEQLWDAVRVEIDDTIAKKNPHRIQWYVEKSKKFQFGYNLVPESDEYDNTGLTEQQIEASKVLRNAAVVEQEISPGRHGLRIKVAGLGAGDLAPVPLPQLDAFKEYIARIKDAGVGVIITTGPADSLKGKLRIFYNPLVLDSQGARLDGAATQPVQDAIKDFLQNIIFNGVFVVQFLVEYLRKIDGVEIPKIDEIAAKYGNLPYSSIDVQYIPDSGYLRIYTIDDLQITWIPYSV